MRKSLILLVAMMMVFSLFLSACTNSEKTSSGDSKTPTKNPADGNALVIGVTGDPHNWDPIDTFLLNWSTVAHSVFEGLVYRTNDLKLKPGLAKSWEYIGDNTLQFKLRKDVTFHNGEPFNAKAVKFTFKRLLGPKGAKGPQQANYDSIDHVEIVDEYTVNFHLKYKDPVLITKLSGYGAVIVPPKYIKEKGDEYFNTHPVGTGPFKMTSYKKDSKIILKKYKDYWQKDVPKMDKVVFRVIPEPSTRLAELRTGAIDIMKGVEVSQAKTVKDISFLKLNEVSSPTVYQFRFDTDEEPVDDPKVRRAINYAIDTKAIIEEILSGYGKQIATFQSELSFGHNPELEPYPYKPEKAKKLLREAGIKKGTPIQIFIPGNESTAKEITQVVAYYLEQVGLKAKINTVEDSTLTSELIPNGDAGHMHYHGWGGWTLDFDNTAYLMYHKGEFWNPDFSDPMVEKLLQAEHTTVDQEKRKQIFKKLTKRLYKLAPEVNLYQQVALWGVNERVKGFKPPHDDRINLKDVTIKK